MITNLLARYNCTSWSRGPSRGTPPVLPGKSAGKAQERSQYAGDDIQLVFQKSTRSLKDDDVVVVDETIPGKMTEMVYG